MTKFQSSVLSKLQAAPFLPTTAELAQQLVTSPSGVGLALASLERNRLVTKVGNTWRAITSDSQSDMAVPPSDTLFDLHGRISSAVAIYDFDQHHTHGCSPGYVAKIGIMKILANIEAELRGTDEESTADAA